MSMIDSIVLESFPHTITLPVLSASPTDQFVLRGASGLGPSEVDVSLAPVPPSGSVYMGAHAHDREIVLLVRLNPDYSGPSYVPPSELRAMFYTLMASGNPITILINTDSLDSPTEYSPSKMKTTGYIRRIEMAPFAKDTDLQITIACPSAVFEALTATNISTALPSPIKYNGTAPAGFRYMFTLLQNVETTLTVRVEHAQFHWETITILAGANLKTNDVVLFDTRPGWREVSVQRASDGSYADLTGKIELGDRIWPMLRPGDNKVLVLESSFAQNPQPTTLLFSYTKQYLGV